MVELAVPADDTCLSRLIEQPLEARAVEQPDDGPSHRREVGHGGHSETLDTALELNAVKASIPPPDTKRRFYVTRCNQSWVVTINTV